MKRTIALIAVLSALMFTSMASAAQRNTFSCSLSKTGFTLVVMSPRYSAVDSICPQLASALHFKLRYGLHVIGEPWVARWINARDHIVIYAQAVKVPALPAFLHVIGEIFASPVWRRASPQVP